MWAEAELKLAQIYEEKESTGKGRSVLNDSLKHYQDAQITQAYGLMSVWFEKGKLAQKTKERRRLCNASSKLKKPRDEYTGLSPNEKLDLWIQQSLCYQPLISSIRRCSSYPG